MRISDWSSDVCSSDLSGQPNGVFERVDAGRFAAAVGEDFPARCPIAFWFDAPRVDAAHRALAAEAVGDVGDEFGTRDRGAVHRDPVGAREQPSPRAIGRASCRERVCQYGYIWVCAGSLTNKSVKRSIHNDVKQNSNIKE